MLKRTTTEVRSLKYIVMFKQALRCPKVNRITHISFLRFFSSVHWKLHLTFNSFNVIYVILDVDLIFTRPFLITVLFVPTRHLPCIRMYYHYYHNYYQDKANCFQAILDHNNGPKFATISEPTNLELIYTNTF